MNFLRTITILTILTILTTVFLSLPHRAFAGSYGPVPRGHDPIGVLQFLTENFAPFNYAKDGTAQGTTVDLLLKMLSAAGSSKTVKDIKVLPWARGYNLAQTAKNTVLFSTTRTASREQMFKWVGPIRPTRIVVIAKKENHIKINSFEDIRKYKIAVVREDIGELLLKKNGLPTSNIQQTNSSASSAKMLIANRVLLWAYDESVALWNLNEQGQKQSDYETVYILEESQLYFAIQVETDDALVAKLQAALDAVRATE